MYQKFEERKPYELLDTSKYPPEVAGRFNSFITTQFDDSLSVEMQMRSIIKWASGNFKHVDEAYNFLIEYMNEFIETFDERYQETILNKMQEWYDNGELEHLINESLDTKYHEMDERITEQFAQATGKDIKEFGVIGDGLVDDTQNIQIALDSEHDIFWSEGTYLFDSVELTKNNKKIVFDDKVVLKSFNAGDTLESGAFIIKGESVLSHNIEQDVLKNDTILYLEHGANDFQVGDLVQITQDSVTVIDLETHEVEYSHTMATVATVDVVNNIVELNEPVNNHYNTLYNPKIAKINPIENVQILGRQTIYDKMGSTEYSNHFFVEYAKNFTISGFDFVSGGGKGLALYRSYGFDVSGVTRFKPSNVSAGHGYGVQINRSSYGTLTNIKGYGDRHTIDFSVSYMVKVYNSHSFNSNFFCHGTNNQHIYFNGCVAENGYFGAGNYSFKSDNNIYFTDCTVIQSPNVSAGFNIAAESYDISIQNCKVFGGFQGLFVGKDCKHIDVSNFTLKNLEHGIQLRGKHCSFDNLSLHNLSESAIAFSQNPSDILFKNTRMFNEIGEIFTVFIFQTDDDVLNVTIDGMDISGDFSRLIHNVTTQTVLKNFTLNNIKYSDNGVRFLELDGVDGLRLSNSNINDLTTITNGNNIVIDNNQFQTSLQLTESDNIQYRNNFTSNSFSVTGHPVLYVLYSVFTGGIENSLQVDKDNPNLVSDYNVQ